MQIVLLLGAPGTGKSTLGQYLAIEHRYEFFSAGNWIREQKLHNTKGLKAKATEALREKISTGSNDILILEFVKDIDDAYSLMDTIRTTQGAKLTLAILLTTKFVCMHKQLLDMLGIRQGSKGWSSHHKKDRMVEERTPKWKANAGRIIEFFSSMRVLATLDSKDTLLPTDNTRTSALLAIHAAPNNIALQPLSWAVSPFLITDKALADSVIHTAAVSAGLLKLCMPVPCVSLKTEADVDWVSQPGRYTVSGKCDGTRYLLIVTASGKVYFKNRVDFVYTFPVDSSLPSDTILDGELVWHNDNGGYFFVFDALMVDGQRVWHLPLPKRLGSLGWLSTQIPRSTVYISGLHRQRMPSMEAKVQVFLKQHYTVQAFQPNVSSFPTDGLVFTPVAMPYVMPVLLRKWQPVHQRTLDIMADNDLVHECVFSGQWKPKAIRWDKTHGQGDERIYYPCRDQELLCGLEEGFLHNLPRVPQPRPHLPPPPRRITMSKKECMHAVAQGLAEHTLDTATGLEIFNNRKGVSKPCRGIVYEGERLVAAAFEPFETSETATEQPASVCASFKIDGTLVIAFLHHGAVCTTTRRRMDSEQALWAKTQIDPALLKEGWTYAFEAVYRNNTVVVPYPFEGLVFLNAWTPDGWSWPHSPFGDSIICTPSLACHASETNQLLLTSERGPPTFEGWVLQTKDGRQLKWVQDAYKHASRLITRNLHPLAVWNEIRMGGNGSTDRQMPEHCVAEKRTMLAALEQAFDDELQQWSASVEVDFDATNTWNHMLPGMRGSYTLPWLSVKKDSMLWRPKMLEDELYHIQTYASSACIKANWMVACGINVDTLSMYYHRGITHSLLRVEIMDRIRPSNHGDLANYKPSANFEQTFAKGWTKQACRTPEPLIHSVLLEHLLEHIFQLTTMDGLAKAVSVCKSWHSMITNDKEIQTRISKSQMGCRFYYSDSGSEGYDFQVAGLGYGSD